VIELLKELSKAACGKIRFSNAKIDDIHKLFGIWQ
jgi:hypothetical protein